MADRSDGMLLKGADVVDGTGAERQRVDVEVEGGRVTAVGPDLSSDHPSVDLSGLVLSPGFVDPHTHYDAQVFWDGDLTPSSWHGVTTVVMGNCGFSLAPTRPEHRDVIVHTLENVEDMSVPALEAGLPWGFETFPEYLDVVSKLPKRVNVACLIGHTALRWYVLGDEAADREATVAEQQRMCDLVREAMRNGAAGFSTSLHNHVGAFGKPVPSRAAGPDELLAIATAMGETGGTMEVAIGDWFGVDDAVRISQASGRPVTWSGAALVPSAGDGGAAAAAAAVEAGSVAGASVFPQFPCRPIVNQVRLQDPFPLRHATDGILEIMRVEPGARLALYADPDWRRRAKEGLRPNWAQRLADATIQETEVHAELKNGPTLGELASQRGTTPFDLMIDLSLAEGLNTRFKVATANSDEAVIAQNLLDRRCLVGLSDGGAHVSQLCDANYATHLLSYWVRERGVLPLELAIWRLTGQPAAVYGLHDRGRIGVGTVADLVAFDPERVGSDEPERVRDFPAGTDRLVAHSTGIEHMWVNGTPVRSGGQDIAGAEPGVRVSPGR